MSLVWFVYLYLTFGTMRRCCTMSVWQMDAIMVKTSSLAESLHTRFSRVFVCCLVSSLWTHSSVISCTEIRLSSWQRRKQMQVERLDSDTFNTDNPVVRYICEKATLLVMYSRPAASPYLKAPSGVLSSNYTIKQCFTTWSLFCLSSCMHT